MIRKTLFWTHLAVGIVSGIVVLILCLTGAILAFEKQIEDWAERDSRALPAAGVTELLSPDVLIANASKVEKDKAVNIEWLADPRMPVRIRYAKQPFVMINGWTGEVLGRGAVSLRGFFRWNKQLHVGLLGMAAGYWIVDVANACFVFLTVSGLYLWWPRQWRWKALRNSIAMPFDVSGKARDWNWHNALGFWFLLPLMLMATSGLVLSFKPVDQWWRSFASRHVLAASQPATLPTTAFQAVGKPLVWNDLMSIAQRCHPGWYAIMFTNPAPLEKLRTVSLIVNLGQPAERTKAHTLVLDKTSGRIIKSNDWANDEPGIRARAIARCGHTGEILGFWGQALALLACLAGIVLIYTGFALSWRRFFGRSRNPVTKLTTP
jgi:uncharacterized iron-regulated membrane protein